MEMESVIIYPTTEVTDLIKLLRPDAVIEQYGEAGNVSVSLPTPRVFEQSDFDCYEMGKVWGCTPEEAAVRMTTEGWSFVEYDAIYGTERFVPQKGGA